MPILSGDDFTPPRRYRNGHYSTFIPYLFGDTPEVDYKRERIDTSDGDFLDLDYSRVGSSKLAVLCHGLEGDSSSGYVLLYADYLNRLGWDVLSLNYRGCSGTPNRKLYMYNSGTTGDLHESIMHKEADYKEIILIGYSLGGNLILKYLGEGKYSYPNKISRAIAISTPIHLQDASKALLKWENIFYQLRFLTSLNKKIIQKKKAFPDQIQLRHLLKTTNLYKFDHYYTAPIFGYKDADEYYSKNQSIQWLDQIEVPVLLINAMDDPFLGPKCYPFERLKKIQNILFCAPEYGGHVGFAYDKNDRSWLLDKTKDFIEGSLL